MTTASKPAAGGASAVPWITALAAVLIHLPVLSRYGFHNDELYFIACGRHFAAGYVDHPPLVPWIARLAAEMFGDSLAGLRIAATLAVAAAVLLAGLLARRLGGGPFAQLLACLGMLVAPVFLRTGNLLCIPAFEPLFWLSGAHILVSLIETGQPRLWMALGLVAGLGLLNKHSMLFFGLGLAVGTVATPLRRHLLTPWPYLGAGAAVLVFLPNLAWQMAHGWPTLHFLLDLNKDTMAGIAAAQFVAGQFLYLNPATAVVWIAGLVFYFSAAGRPYRALGWIWVTVFLLLLMVKSKIYYLAPAYPALLAGGGVALERWIARRGAAWPRPALVALLLAGGIGLAPLSLPMLSLPATERYVRAATFGAFENIHEITGDLRAMFGWPERVDAVARAFATLPVEARQDLVIWAPGYGTAGAIDVFGPAHGLPAAVSTANSYWMWGLPDRPIGSVLSAGFGRETLDRVFEQVEVLERITIEHASPRDQEFIVAWCRAPRRALPEIWQRNRPW